MWQSFPASLLLMFFGEGDLCFADWLIFYCGSLASACYIWISPISHCITGSTSIWCQSLGLTTVTNETLKNYRNTLPGGIPCTDASKHTNARIQNRTCTQTFSLPLCMLSHTYKAQRSGTSSNLKNLRYTCCSTHCCVFAAILDDFLLRTHTQTTNFF